MEGFAHGITDWVADPLGDCNKPREIGYTELGGPVYPDFSMDSRAIDLQQTLWLSLAENHGGLSRSQSW